MNKDYLNTIRANSCYPTYRMLVDWVSAVSYILVGVFGIGTTIAAFLAEIQQSLCPFFLLWRYRCLFY